MQICDTREHREIVHDSVFCRACDTIIDLREKIKDLEQELKDERSRHEE